ncbi:protein mono-ADP-ribosyltransferase TIPARP-like isoform X2 [Festucalex cinctus]
MKTTFVQLQGQMKRTQTPDTESPHSNPQPSFVLLEMPLGSAYLLPPQVDVSWTLEPYRLSAHFTLRYPWGGGPNWSAANNSCLLLGAPRPPQVPQLQPPIRPPVLPPPSIAFYTWTSDHVEICDKFLLGSCQDCQEPDVCKMHHTPLPFHWQLYSGVERRWVDINPRAQLLLERMYCNVDRETTILAEGHTSFILSLDNLTIMDTHKYERARRLSNSDSLLQNPYFPCEWRIYWWDGNTWVEYNKWVSDLLLGKMASKEVACTFKVGSQEYKVDFTTMTQSNLTSGFSRKVRRRPVYRPPEFLRTYLRTCVQIDPIQYTFHANFNVNPLEDFSTWYPPVWCLGLDQDCRLVDVPVGTHAFNTVRKFFYKSLPETKVEIVVIQQVQNVLHWDKYQRHKVYMQKKHAGSRDPLERHLFHGTTQEASEHIYRDNFDTRMAGTNGSLLGHGSYFATSASVSHNYANKSVPQQLRHMFLTKVLVGKMTLGHPMYRRPPLCDSNTNFYDSCVDSVQDPKVFVVFDSCQCYPYYLIKYKDLNGVIEL